MACRWFEGFDWEGLAARKIAPPRKPKDDAAKRIRELAVSSSCCQGHAGRTEAMGRQGRIWNPGIMLAECVSRHGL